MRISRGYISGRAAGVTILGMVLLASTGACREYSDGIREVPLDGDELPILRQVCGTHSHETQAMRVVVRDPGTLARIPIQDVPVDFSHEMVLIVTLGRVTSDQYRVAVERVWRDGPTLRVRIIVSSPPAGSPTAMASPFCIAVVPHCDLNVAGFATEPPGRAPSWQQSPLPERW